MIRKSTYFYIWIVESIGVAAFIYSNLNLYLRDNFPNKMRRGNIYFCYEISLFWVNMLLSSLEIRQSVSGGMMFEVQLIIHILFVCSSIRHNFYIADHLLTR